MRLKKVVNRKICFYKNYFKGFYVEQTEVVRLKINYCLNVVKTAERIPSAFLRSIETVGGLYEIRVEAGGNIFRIFCCFDEGAVVILFNGFQKKTQKTPSKEIEKAKRIMKEYFDDKHE